MGEKESLNSPSACYHQREAIEYFQTIMYNHKQPHLPFIFIYRCLCVCVRALVYREGVGIKVSDGVLSLISTVKEK